VRFDSDANLQAWVNSQARLDLPKEAVPFTEEFHARIVRTGFDQWFKVAEGVGQRRHLHEPSSSLGLTGALCPIGDLARRGHRP
jgi:hypothetical protein